MFKSRLVPCAYALALLTSQPLYGATDAELAEIREQIRQLKESYEARIQALEQKLKTTEQPLATGPSAAPPVAVPPAPPAASPTIASQPTTASSASAFNPAISAVLQGLYTNLSQDPNHYAIAGFVPSGGQVAPPKRGFSLAESELQLSANVDDKIFANLVLAVTPEDTVEVEEAYGMLTALPNGLTPKFGRFLSSIGYLNDQHQHTWDFVDAPLPYQAFLGGRYRSDGLQLKWVAPTDTFLELGTELGDGSNFPGTERNRNGIGSVAAYAHAGGDIDASHSWRAGLSYLRTRPEDRQYTQGSVDGDEADIAFSGKSQIAIADFVWKYAPSGNARHTSFKLQGEYFWRRETGDLTFDRSGAPGLTNTSSYSSRQSGWYLSGVYQFVPRWRVGMRYDRLDPGTIDYGANDVYLTPSSVDPWRAALMFDYSPSEFSRFRVQWQQSKVRADLTDNQLFIQYILTLGAHSAHKF